MITTLIRTLYYILFFFTPLLVFPHTSELFEFNKMLFIYLITASALSLWLLRTVIETHWKTIVPFIFVPLGIFLISQIISTVFSIDFHTSLFGYYGRLNGGLISLFSFSFLLFVFLQTFDTGTIKKLLTVSLVSSFIVILWALPGKFGHDLSCMVLTVNLADLFNLQNLPALIEEMKASVNNNCWTNQFRPAERAFSTLGQPNWLGAYLSIHLFLVMPFLFSATSRLSLIVLYGYVFMNFMMILFTRSDSALLASGAGLVIFGGTLLLHDRTIKLKANRTRLLVVAAIIVVCVLLFKTGISKVDSLLTLSTYTQALKSKQPVGPPAKTNTTSSEPTLNNVTDSFDIRKIVWKGAVDIGRSYPLYGTGVETFAYSYYMKRPIEHNATSEWDYLYNKAHNELLNYFANTGFIGFGTYVLLLGYIFYLLIQGVRQTLFGSKKLNDSPFIRILPLGLFSAFTTIFVTNFFGFSTSTVHLFFFIIPGLFLVPSVLHHKEEAKHTNPMFAGAKAIFILLFFLLCMTYLYNYYRADMKYAMADTHMRANEFSSAATVLNEALGIHYEHVYEDKLSFVLANLAYVTAYQQETETASKLRDLSAHYNIRSLRSSPFNVLYWKTKAKNHYLFYQMNQSIEEIEEGIQALQQAEKISPTDPKISYSLAVFYSVLEEAATAPDEIELNRAQALKEINKSIALKDDYTDSYMLKGQLLEKFGKPNEAKAVFEYILQKLDANHREAKTELLDN